MAAEASALQKSLEIVPPAERRFEVQLPSGITAYEYDVVRLAARFVAINGPAFNQALYVRESQNPSFAFLVDQSHPHRQLFLELTRQYELILEQIDKEPSSDLSLDRAVLLDKIVQRTQFERNVRVKAAAAERGKKQGSATLEEMSTAIDWDDFVVVQVLALDDDVSTLAEPTTLAQLKMAPALAAANAKLSVQPPAAQQQSGAAQQQQQQQQHQQQLQQAQTAAVEDEVVKPSLKMAGVQVVQNYTPGAAGAILGPALETHQRCPICNQLIPISQMEQHMKIETMSKKHLEQLKEAAVGKKSAMAPDDEIAANIAAFSKIRTDIFDHGDVEPEELIEQRKKRKLQQKMIWDGHQDTAEGTMNLEDQIRMIHATKGSDVVHDNPNIGPANPRRVSAAPQVVTPVPAVQPAYPAPPGIGGVVAMPPPPPGVPGFGLAGVAYKTAAGQPIYPAPGMLAPPGTAIPPPGLMMAPPGLMMGGPPPGYPQQHPVPSAPPQLQLIEENEWAESHPLSFEIQVVVPSQENDKGWRLDGSTLTFSVKLNQSIDSIKSLVEREIALPAKLQKLKHSQRGVLKDGKSLAAYNFTDGDVLELDVSKRGGKK